MLKGVALCTVLSTLSLVAQTATHKSTAGTPSNSGQSQSNPVNDRIAALEKRVEKLETSVTIYKFLIDQKQDKSDTIYLDPRSHDFIRLDSDTGTFLVLLQDATPYLNGYRIKLDIGNPWDAKFPNAKIKVRWGHKIQATENYSDWQASLHDKEIDLPDSLEAGMWNHVTLDLIPCAANELGYFEFSMQTPSIILHTNGEQ
jgi:hypothetical protein